MKLVNENGEELEIRVLELEPRDIIILKYPGVLKAESRDWILKSWNHMGIVNKCVILEEGIEIEVLRPELISDANQKS